MGLLLVANPGSSSRKYALYDDELRLRAELHIETTDHHLVGSLEVGDEKRNVSIEFSDIAESAHHVTALLKHENVLSDEETIERIGLRIVAPGGYFMDDHIVDDEVIGKLEAALHLAPLHISATLHELTLLREVYPETPIIGVSDSAFHRTKPNYAWNYGIDIHDADRLDIKRFGYHGISTSSVIDTLWNSGKLPPKVVVCHLGSGSSITAVYHGRSIDTTMGFTPNEGVIMATRSGNISPDAARALRSQLHLDDEALETYLNTKSGLVGFSGSNDIRELITRETNGDHMAHLALTTLVHTIHKAIGSMIVAMNGCDMIVFTGTVGERSAILRKRIIAHLSFLDFILDGTKNDETMGTEKLTIISQTAKSRPIAVIPTDEAKQIALRTSKVLL